ncbi:hypothetical protein HUT18_00160 [Streptomyces sp. NA04227]|uniref:hypothetical protein n=1 Tax=Streptomyces sp. NA04227 TaxID=2742136 RepID=UPI001592A967|nr:hypothetical protein [Streptomyces sp. NA04227]QKW05000.1 hypothetical protein HUT18_00160 [Streptomyces sp. NA04227]
MGRAGDAGRARAAEGGDWLLEALDRVPAPEVPVREPWKISLGVLLSAHPLVPALAARPLKLLDGLGAIHLSPQSVGFDGTEVEWEKVTEIRMRGGGRSLAKDAIDSSFDAIRDALLLVPGKNWALGKLAEGLTTLLFRIMENAEGSEQYLDVLVPGTIVYKGRFGRSKECAASVYPVLLQLVRPDIVAALMATAEAHGVPVVRPEGDDPDVCELAEIEGALREAEARALAVSRDEEAVPPAQPLPEGASGAGGGGGGGAQE